MKAATRTHGSNWSIISAETNPSNTSASGSNTRVFIGALMVLRLPLVEHNVIYSQMVMPANINN